MPIKPQDTDKLKTPPADTFGSDKKDKPSDDPTKPIQTNYGFGQKAHFNSDRDVTDKQEYVDGALPDTAKYSVDKP